jgi:hypothetical protein
MKVACIGNMNNMMFTLCRYLRDNNINSHLFLFEDEAAHFLPESDSYDDDYKKYSSTLPVDRKNFTNLNIKKLQSILKDYVFFIGTDIAPALLTLLGKRINVFIPHGSDLYALPFTLTSKKKYDKIWWAREVYYIGLIQRIGVENAYTILFPEEYDEQFPYKHKLNCKGVFHNTSGPMVYAPQYRSLSQNREIRKLKYYDYFKELRGEYELIVFSHSRQNGLNLPEHQKIHEKGNDILINGYASFVVQNRKIKTCLVLFDYGMDVNSAKQLVSKLNIDKYVIWMPKMDRKEIMFGMMNSDICCGLFKNSWLTCGVVNETLSLGKPLIHYRNDSLYVKDYPELYPILNANSAKEVCNQIINYTKNKEEIIKQSLKGINWLEEFTVKRPLKIILQELSFRKSIVLSRWEKIRVYWSGIKFRIAVNYLKIVAKFR